jgi:hypothetical protein
MPDTREFPTAVIASLSSGVLLCPFEKMHEAAEYLMGHPIWTSHFASNWRDMQRAILLQCPGMPTSLDDVTKDNWEAKLTALVAELGATQTIRKGDGLTAMLPTDGIPDHVQVITI